MNILGKGKSSVESDEDKQIREETEAIWKYVFESRRRRELDWFYNDQYYDNNQYLQFNTAARRVQSVATEQTLDRVVINKCKQQVRGVNNFLNAEHPMVGITPGDQADDAYLRARKEQHLVEYWYDHLKLKKVGKLVSKDGCKYGVGWAKVTWDQDALSPTTPFTASDGTTRTGQYGEVRIDRVDPFEVYPDPMAHDMDDMRYIVHAPVRTLGELQSNPLYRNTDKLQADARLSSSHLKQAELLLRMSGGLPYAMGQTNGMDTVVTLEIFRRIYSQKTGKWEIWVTTRTLGGVILRHAKWPMDVFPFAYFQTEVESLILDSKGVIHDIREPNRALNQIVTQIQESARVMGKINWRAVRGSNLNVIDDTTGQILEYDPVPGGAPEQVSPVGLPSYIMQLPNLLVSFIEDVGGIHASFNGKAPFAQASGDLVDSLSEGDQNSLTEYRDNYDDFWIRLFKLAFHTVKVNGAATRKIPTRQTDAFGEYQWEDLNPKDISTSDDINVNTGSDMPYSTSQKHQMFMNLWKDKVITDPDALLKLLQLPDLDNIQGDDEDDIVRQLSEIKEAIKGQQIPAPVLSENHQVHVQTLDKFVRGSTFKTLKADQQQAVLDHRQAHVELMIQLQQIQQAMQMEPIKRSATFMVRPTNMNELTPIERTQILQKTIGIQSDAASVQLRGGLYIQDPAQAEMQAQNEDIEMMDMRPVQVSFGDNHQVHIETHAQLLDQLVAEQQKGAPVSQIVVQLFQQHIKDHTDAMTAILSAPGLVPNDQISMPQEPHNNETPSGQMPAGAKAPQQQANPTPSQVKVAPATKPVQRLTSSKRSSTSNKRK